MAAALDMDHIAKSLGAQRRGKVAAKGGYFGALNLAALSANVPASRKVSQKHESFSDAGRSPVAGEGSQSSGERVETEARK
jgi:hypothetical protein